MIKKEKLLEDIYKHYPNCLHTDLNNKSFFLQQKIREKGLFKNQKMFLDLKNRFSEYSIIDWTDETACCYEFKILLQPDQDILDDDIFLIQSLNGKRYDLRVFISILEPYYYLFVEETIYLKETNKWLFKTITNYPKETKELIVDLEQYLFSKGYRQLSDNDIKIIVPNVETELKEINKTTVFDCLFTDLVTIV